jgi:hypothetical protein
MTWLINKDREFLQGAAMSATKSGAKVFPYFASPNTALQVVAESGDLASSPDKVWALIGPPIDTQSDRYDRTVQELATMTAASYLAFALRLNSSRSIHATS